MYELRDYQKKVHDSTIEHMRETYRSGKFDPAFASVTVGGGKTVLIAFAAKQIMSREGNSVLVLARQGELIDQNAIDARSVGLKLSIFSASLNQKSTYYPTIFGTEGTVGRALNNEFKDRTFTAILIDECHHVDWQSCLDDSDDGTQYSKIIKHFQSNAQRLGKKPPLIIGYTGSPYRGSESIYGKFWRKQLSDVSTYELISKGFLVPPVFGFGSGDLHYDALDKYQVKGGDGAQDFTSKELAAMGREICKEQTKTQQIMQEVMHRTKDRDGGVMITCASKKHCEQVAECLPDGSWGIVTDSTSTKKRMEIIKGIKENKIKYIIQIGCLSTGFNAPTLSTSVILRNIGSLTLMIQLIGRVLRILKPEHVEKGMVKDDALILDYSSSLEAMGDIYSDPILEQAKLSKGMKEGETQECPICATENTEHAIRCIGQSQNSTDGRCEHFFMFNECKNCGTHNAPSAKSCRSCQAVLIDPNAALINKAYSDADYKKVISMTIGETQGGKIKVSYHLDSTVMVMGIEQPEIATEFLDPFFNVQFQRARWAKFIKEHIFSEQWQKAMRQCKDIDEVLRNKAAFMAPNFITHRKNEKGFSVINRKVFNGEV